MHVAVLGIKGLPSKGGGERVAETIINKALENGYNITLYSKRNYTPKNELPSNIHFILIRDLPGKHLSAVSFGLLSAFHAILFCHYDLIHLHYADFGFLVPLLKLRYKIIGTSHGAEYNREKWGKFAKISFKLFEKPFVKYTDICTSVSRSLAKYYQKKYKKKIYYIPNGINVSDKLFEQKGFYKKLGLNKNDYILFAAGRIIPSKGLAFLLEANENLRLDIPIVVAGKVEKNSNYINILAKFKRENVKYIGFLEDKSELYNLINNCKIFVFPSTYEAMSIILLEVAMFGKCIICSDIIQNIDAIEDNAIYFKSANPIDLSKKIEFVLSHKHETDAISRKAKEWVISHRDNDKINEKYISLYNSLRNL